MPTLWDTIKTAKNPRIAARIAYDQIQRLDLRRESDDKISRDAGAYWSKSDSSQTIRSLSHWRGEGRWDDDASWLAIGADNVGRFKELLGRERGEQKLSRVMEWGPGGGSNVLAFCDSFPISAYYGVDISANNLAECGRQCAGAGISAFEAIQIDPVIPDTVAGHVGKGTLDLFLSTASD
jgi:hypothetical protein